MKLAKFGDILAKACEIIHEVAVRRRIDHRAIGMLAVDFHECRANCTQRLHGNGLIVHIGAAAAIRHLHAAQDEIALDLGTRLKGGGYGRVIGRQVEHRRDLALRCSSTHERAIATPPQGKRQRIEQDGFAGAGFTREHGEALLEGKVQLFDQDDVADREPGEHGLLCPVVRGRPRGPSSAGSC